MTKSDKITAGTKVSWQDISGPRDGSALARQIMNIMEQGIVVWGPDGACQLHNTRIFEVLELDSGALTIGTHYDDFLESAYQRGEFTKDVHDHVRRRFEGQIAFQFDRTLPSGRVVSTNARPTREGGYVVTSTDVTEARTAVVEMGKAKQAAEDAHARAREVLEEERARRAEARTLYDLDEWLQSCKSLSELYMIVTKFMDRLMPGCAGELYIYSNSRDVLDGVCEWGQQGRVHDHIAPDACWSLRRGRTYEYNPDALCFHCDHAGDAYDADQDYVCIPVVAHGDTVGLLHVSFPADMQRNDVKTNGRFAKRCAEHISMVIANVKLRDELHDQSIRDPLTGLYNRRYFMDAMRRETVVAEREKKGFGLISLDADNFKTFNDNHGHDAGDTVLRALAERMHSVMPFGAVCARVGGEEFTILLPGHDLSATQTQAEALRTAVAGMSVSTAFGPLPRVTVSAGVVANTGEKIPPSVLIKHADNALYAAKAAGRNCVEVAKI